MDAPQSWAAPRLQTSVSRRSALGATSLPADPGDPEAPGSGGCPALTAAGRVPLTAWAREEGRSYGGGMVTAWVLVAVASLAALGCGYGAARLARRPPEERR
jgi:hypothetical protein